MKTEYYGDLQRVILESLPEVGKEPQEGEGGTMPGVYTKLKFQAARWETSCTQSMG